MSGQMFNNSFRSSYIAPAALSKPPVPVKPFGNTSPSFARPKYPPGQKSFPIPNSPGFAGPPRHFSPPVRHYYPPHSHPLNHHTPLPSSPVFFPSSSRLPIGQPSSPLPMALPMVQSPPALLPLSPYNGMMPGDMMLLPVVFQRGEQVSPQGLTSILVAILILLALDLVFVRPRKYTLRTQQQTDTP